MQELSIFRTGIEQLIHCQIIHTNQPYT